MNRLTAKEARENLNNAIEAKVEETLVAIMVAIRTEISALNDSLIILRGTCGNADVPREVRIKVLSTLSKDGFDIENVNYGDTPHWVISW